MKITAAVCTYERYATLAATICSLREQSLAAEDYEVLVLDSSRDGQRAREFAAGYGDVANLRFVRLDVPGLSNARNVATATAQTPLIAFIDDDALAAGDWLEQIVATFAAASADVAAVGGPVEPLWEAPRPIWLHDGLLGYLSVLDWGDRPLVLGQDRWLIGTNVAYRREALLATGGFREDLSRRGDVLVSNEELEMHDRLQAAGGRLFYSPAVRVTHRIPPARLTQAWFRRRIFWQAVSDLIAGRVSTDLTTPQAKGWWTGETNDPKAFNRECRRITELVQHLNAGRRS
jgi:glycosyltransferase involved in cell wall biosynthesis